MGLLLQTAPCRSSVDVTAAASTPLEADRVRGQLITTEGRYATVWRKDTGGRWRCVIDIYNDGPATTGPSHGGPA